MVAMARAYLGTPYHHCGRSRHGLDCAGLLVLVAHDMGLSDWDAVDYSQQVRGDHLMAQLERFFERVGDGEQEASPGDVFLFACWGNPTHVGIATGEGTFVHAFNDRGTGADGAVVETRLDALWRRMLKGVYRWRR